MTYPQITPHMRSITAAFGILVLAGCSESFINDLDRGSQRKSLNATMTVDGVVLTVPGCPDWTKPTRVNFSNSVHTNFGCADAANLGAMLANPTDAYFGRKPGTADGAVAAAAIQRYRSGETKPLLDGASEPATTTGGEDGGGAEEK